MWRCREALDNSSRASQYEAEVHGLLAPLYGNHDAGDCALYFGAWTLGLLGLPDRAVEMSRAAITRRARVAKDLERCPPSCHRLASFPSGAYRCRLVYS